MSTCIWSIQPHYTKLFEPLNGFIRHHKAVIACTLCKHSVSSYFVNSDAVLVYVILPPLRSKCTQPYNFKLWIPTFVKLTSHWSVIITTQKYSKTVFTVSKNE